ncbi:Crp/Fnr family transcriptional regulator, partial [Helicobacter rodentium]
FDSLENRILNFLYNNAPKESKILYITHEEIANALGSAREAISRVLKDLKKQGKLKTKRGLIELVDFPDS